MDVKKFQEILADEAFAQSLFKMETAEEVQAALKEKGLEISVEELCRVRDKLIGAESVELNDDELDAVAGGVSLSEMNNLGTITPLQPTIAPPSPFGLPLKW